MVNLDISVFNIKLVYFYNILLRNIKILSILVNRNLKVAAVVIDS